MIGRFKLIIQCLLFSYHYYYYILSLLMCSLVLQKRESSGGCWSRLFCELFMALFMPTRTDSIVHLRFQFLIAGSVVSMIPVL